MVSGVSANSPKRLLSDIVQNDLGADPFIATYSVYPFLCV
jgi:hypothetical protein